jgi:beta-galactosidase
MNQSRCLLVFAFIVSFVSLRGETERLSFDSTWRFMKGDPSGAAKALGYEKIRPWLTPVGAELLNFSTSSSGRPAAEPGNDVAWARLEFDDAAWRKLDLPHDWGIEGPFQQELEGDTAKLPWFGVGWYRKHFEIAPADSGKRIYLDVDGAMSHALVWCNGRFVGGWPYGYASWRLDLTPYLKFGSDNVIAIRLDNPPESSRWYPGGGLYRNVWLVKSAPVHVAHWGIGITTPRVSREHATVSVNTTVENDVDAPAEVTVSSRLFVADEEGRPTGGAIATAAALPLSIAKRARAQLTEALAVASPRLWSVNTPQRYVAETLVVRNGTPVDRVLTPFGIRSIEFTADRGFLLNGERVPINGVCDHHDLGALGAAINVRALQRQLEILRAMGCNAIRTSHNPPAPELLELCDRMGFVVMDEAFDCWRSGKRTNDYHLVFDDWHEKDLRALVRRDRNHPCVILWSIGNEIREQDEPEGWKIAAHLAGIVREEDRTRPVTAGLNHFRSAYAGFETAVDVVGFNYKPAQYAPYRERYPTVPLYGSETSSCVSSRGEYFFPVSNDKAEGSANFQVSSYDLYAPPWAFPPDTEWEGLDRASFTAGEFVWTGFDYLGEPTPYGSDATNLLNFTDPAEKARAEKQLAELRKIEVPSRSSYFGIVDLAGFPKDRYYLYQARWRPDLRMAHILPHWNWPERVGQVTPVHVYSSADEAELFLNGKSLGRKKRGEFEYRFRWDDVVYQPGELKVVTWKHGQPWAEATERTTGAAAKILLRTDREKLRAMEATAGMAAADLAYVTATIGDANDQLVPRSKNLLRFSVDGPAEIVATDNGDATNLTRFQTPDRNAFNGLALVILRPKPGAHGPVTLRAESPGLAASEITLHVE